MSRTTDTNLDCVLVENTLVFVVPNILELGPLGTFYDSLKAKSRQVRATFLLKSKQFSNAANLRTKVLTIGDVKG